MRLKKKKEESFDFHALFFINILNEKNIFSDGCLGSRNDEERSEMRYVMRIADLVNHQNFERTLHNFVVCLLECLLTSIKKVFLLFREMIFFGQSTAFLIRTIFSSCISHVKKELLQSPSFLRV